MDILRSVSRLSVIGLLFSAFGTVQPAYAEYRPEGRAFVVENGDARFTRALYGGPSAFRLETSDRPEFGLWMPGMGGNVTFSVTVDKQKLPLLEAADIVCRYTEAARVYVISDPLFRGGTVTLTARASDEYEGAFWKVEYDKMPASTRIGVRYGGASGKRFSRNGDLGVDPADAFALTPEGCADNAYTLHANTFSVDYAQASRNGVQTIKGCFPQGAILKVNSLAENAPVLDAEWKIGRNSSYVYIGASSTVPYTRMAQVYESTAQRQKALTERIVFNTPDSLLNTLGGALVAAADGIWDGQTWLHGAIGWRTPLAGWRAAYAGDILGWHDRARSHFNAYAASQVVDVEPSIPSPTQDPEQGLARAEKRWGTQMYSKGYICRNPGRNDQMHHYDMNLNYIDELLWHLQWTGDWAYAQSIFPVIERSLAWEKRNFDPDGDGLYDAYCCIWASDGLYYSGGAVTHSSALNYRANLLASVIAERLGERTKATYYKEEAERIRTALAQVLWDEKSGVWAECRDLMGLQRLHTMPGVWTVYHAIDSQVGTPIMNYRSTQYIDREIPHIPVICKDRFGVPQYDSIYTISSTTWQPYGWSTNNVAFAEVMNTALAYWQAARYEEGYNLLRASVLDGMYFGASPANFGQISKYDVARSECYRDFGDVVGVASRALIQGLFGVLPDRLNDQIILQPGFPASWDAASLTTPDISYSFQRYGATETYRIHLAEGFRSDVLMLRLRAYYDYLSSVAINGSKASFQLAPDAVGFPMVEIPVFPNGEGDFEVVVRWAGTAIDDTPTDDGTFRQVEQGIMQWIRPAANPPSASPRLGTLPMSDFDEVRISALDPVMLDGLYNDSVTNIFKPRYLMPRPSVTSLEMPVTGIGDWCHPTMTFEVRDDAARASSVLQTPMNVPFSVATEGHNVLFTSMWSNFPSKAYIPLSGRASHAYFMLVGTTNAMQSQIANAQLRVAYADGTADTLLLVNPYNWCPIEQDYYDDGLAFNLRGYRPWRMMLQTGEFSRVLSAEVAAKAQAQPYTNVVVQTVDTNASGIFGAQLPGGAAQFLDMRLNPSKQLLMLELETLSNDVIVGLMGLTLQR